MRKLVTLQAFLSDDIDIKTIVQACDLQPTQDWRVWQSRFGYVLTARPNKTIQIKKKKYSGKPDLFANASVQQIAESSKLFVYANNKLTFWCDDDRFRAFEYTDCWKRICPLQIPLKTLRKLVRFENVEPDETGWQKTVEGFFCWLPLDDCKIQKINEEEWKSRLEILIPAHSNT